MKLTELCPPNEPLAFIVQLLAKPASDDRLDLTAHSVCHEVMQLQKLNILTFTRPGLTRQNVFIILFFFFFSK